MTLAKPIRTCTEAYAEANKILNESIRRDDDGRFHSDFDELIEKRLMELDPEFMCLMNDLYTQSRLSRWYE
jgi:hypothetical protein